MVKEKKITWKNTQDQSVIDRLANLACERGHKSFSPAPMSFVGHECRAKRENGLTCRKPLVFMRHSRDIPQPTPKVKRSRLLRIKRT